MDRSRSRTPRRARNHSTASSAGNISHYFMDGIRPDNIRRHVNTSAHTIRIQNMSIDVPRPTTRWHVDMTPHCVTTRWPAIPWDRGVAYGIAAAQANMLHQNIMEAIMEQDNQYMALYRDHLSVFLQFFLQTHRITHSDRRPHIRPMQFLFLHDLSDVMPLRRGDWYAYNMDPNNTNPRWNILQYSNGGPIWWQNAEHVPRAIHEAFMEHYVDQQAIL